jgi:hypothetical protein
MLDNVTSSPIGKWDCNSDPLEMMVEVWPLFNSFLKNFVLFIFHFVCFPDC